MYILALESLLVALVTFGLTMLNKKAKFFINKPRWVQQIIIGLIYGALATFLSQFGFLEDDFINENIRDAAPICAGLFFGMPAGIISGVIGGIYRYVSVYWGASETTQIACALCTVFSGISAGAARKFMFKDNNPGIVFAFWVAAGCETLDMLLIFLTNMNDLTMAYQIVDKATFVLLGFNMIAVGLSDVIVEPEQFKITKPRKLRPSFVSNLNISIIALITVTGIITYIINKGIAESQAISNLTYNINNVYKQVVDENKVNDSIKSWSVGNTGGILVYKDDELLSCSQYGMEQDITTINFEMPDKDVDIYTLTKAKLNDEDIYVAYYFDAEESPYKVYAYMSQLDVYLTSNTTLYTTLYTEILIYITLLCLIYQIVEAKMIKPIHKVNKQLEQITSGELNTSINIQNSYEMKELSKDFNLTVTSLRSLISEAEHRNEKELELAKLIQMSAVPSSFPAFATRTEIDIFASMHTAKEVGGDFYDFYFVDDTHLAMLIADVSGKGIPAAMFMMSAKTLIKSLAESGKSVDEIFKEANIKLCKSNEAEMFLTAWMGIIDLETGILSFVSAGHNPPLLYRKNQEFTYIKEKPNFIMAGLSTSKYVKHDYQLNPGDKIYLYTDGVTEAEDINHGQYGEEQLLKTLNKNKDLPVTDIAENILKDVQGFVKDAPQSDDITMLSFELKHLKSLNSITVYPDSDSIVTITNFVIDRLTKLNISSSIRNKIEITVDEIFSNIQKYGKASKATISFDFNKDKLTIKFIDNGYQFDPLAKKDPNVSLTADEREIGGLGIFMVKKLASSISYKYENNENILSIDFDLNNKEKA